MGMGEPLHNYDATMKALRMLADEQGLGVHPKRVTLSTVGVLPALERLAGEPLMPNLAVSLHATTDALRDQLVPINRKYKLAELMAALEKFPLRSRGRITFEYVLLDGVNDRPADARRLVGLIAGLKSKVNLLPLNEAPGIPFRRPSDERVNEFATHPGRSRRHRLGQKEPRPGHQRGLRTAHRPGRYSERRNARSFVKSSGLSRSNPRAAAAASAPCRRTASGIVAALPSCRNGRRACNPHNAGVRISLADALPWRMPSPVPTSWSRRSE